MEQLLFLLVIGLIALVRKLFMEGGLERMLGKLNTDLNQPSDELRRTTPPPIRRPASPSLSPEDERARKFREALGLPPEDTAPRRAPARLPVPPIVSQPTHPSPADRARQERQRIERKLAERKRALQQTPPSPPPALPKPSAPVSTYFEMDRFNRPDIDPEKTSIAVQVDAPIIEADFFKTLEKRELVPVSAQNRLSEVFGAGSDLRRLILAKEILGRPKSLQNA